ncbi:MAG: glycosyltransferase family 2 protein [Clostridia bacterium]|nr:glycosyltransferase family 2 protein [Clostridia bacterium]
MNNAEIKVSVIIPVYNTGEFLRPALDSVIDQTLREIEIICVDDGSTDRSLDILKEYQKADERIRIVTETNAGPALARNNGIRRARGEYIAFLDADDFFELDMLEKLYLEAKANDLDIVVSDYDIYNSHRAVFTKAAPAEHEEIFDGVSVTSKNEHPDSIFTSTNGAAWNKLFRTSFVIDKGLSFLPDVKLYEDVYFVICALSLAQRVGKVHNVLLHHRVYSEQFRARQFKKYYAQVPEIYGKLKRFLMSTGMYAPLSDAFSNLTASRCYKIYNFLGSDAKGHFWDLLHEGAAETLGWHGGSLTVYEDIEVCEFAASVEMFTHKQYKRRLSKGQSLRMDNLSRTLRKAKQRKRMLGFFGRIVPIGKKKSKTK